MRLRLEQCSCSGRQPLSSCSYVSQRWSRTWSRTFSRRIGRNTSVVAAAATEDEDDDDDDDVNTTTTLSLIGRSTREGHSPGALSPVTFAFLGDVVWELHARTKCLLPPSRVGTYRKSTERVVMAEHQAACLDKLAEHLSEEEENVVKRGRNCETPSVPKRLRGNADSKTVYAKATALECLIGYLYLTDPARLDEVMQILDMKTNEKIKVRRDKQQVGMVVVGQEEEEEAALDNGGKIVAPPQITLKREKGTASSEPKGFGGKV